MKLIIIAGLLIPILAFGHLSGNHNIDTNSVGYHWAWNDIVGWIDFHANSTVEVNGSELRGWAESSLGPIVFNCATTPSGDICGSSNFRVVNNGGALSGWAWNDVVGWISFDCQDIGACGVSPYQVTIEPAGGESFFKNWAWNDVIGWISFHCENQGLCALFPQYRVQTSAGSAPASGVLESNVFDTGFANPAFNYIMWQGTPFTGTSVGFQVASSDNSAGPWSFDAPTTAAVGQRLPIGDQHQGKRYVKYRVVITGDSWGGGTPVISDIIINYSP